MQLTRPLIIRLAIGRNLARRCLALPLVLCLLAVHSADALSAGLYINSDCSGTTYLTASNLESGDCFHVGGYGGRITCTPDGLVSQAALYEDRDSCSITFIAGRGTGDGVSCVTMRSPRTSVVWSTIVNYAAPGDKSSSSLSAGIIAAAVIGAVVGMALLLSGAWWCYRWHKTARAVQLQHSVHMQQPQQHYAPSGNSANHLPPGAMMALVCCVALLLPIMPADAAIQLTPEFTDAATTGAMILLGTIVFASTGVIGILLCCCPYVFIKTAALRWY